MSKDTTIICGFTGTGKTYYTNNNVTNKVILDMDSSSYIWVHDEYGNMTDLTDPDFPDNYINDIKKNIGKVDVLFIDTNKCVRDALSEGGIAHYIIIPNIVDDIPMDIMGTYQYDVQEDILQNENKYGRVILLDENEYIEDVMDRIRW